MLSSLYENGSKTSHAIVIADKNVTVQSMPDAGDGIRQLGLLLVDDNRSIFEFGKFFFDINSVDLKIVNKGKENLEAI